MALSRFFRFLDEHAGKRRRTMLVGGVGSGLFQGLTIAVLGMGIDQFATDHAVSFRILLLFALSVFGYYWTFRLAMDASTSVAFEAVSDIQLRISNKLRQMDYPSFTRLERSQVYAALMGNKDIVVEAARFLVSFTSGGAMMLCAFVYAACICIPGVVLILAILSVCGAIFVQNLRKVHSQQETAQLREKEFLASLEDLLDGFTELKMHRPKSDDLYESGIQKLCRQAIAAKRAVERSNIEGTAFSTTFAYLPVGAAIFFLPQFSSVTTEQLIKLIAVTLFSLSPLMGLVLFIPMMTKAEMLLAPLLSFEAFLDARQEPVLDQPRQAPEFQHLAIREGVFRYTAPAGQHPFALNINEFNLCRGELVFLAGANGSGKTTFMHILAGLLPLDSGEILVDGQSLAALGLEDYRSLFSIIFSDFHLFDTLYGLKEPDPEHMKALLAQMGLTDKVRLEGRRFSTTKLSSGQRKRLALIAVMLEDRPILLFDEVAADFDFNFREYFYKTLLPALKAQGKTILAVSHDDRYFQVADRVLYMRYGDFEPFPPPKAKRTAGKKKK